MAGHIEAGDDSATTVVREVGEELGLEVTLEEARSAFLFQTKIQASRLLTLPVCAQQRDVL